MQYDLKDWSSVALVKYNQWKNRQIKDELRAPCFEQLKYSTTTFDQVRKLEYPDQDWRDQAKSIRKKLCYYLMTKSVVALPADYKKKCDKVRNKIDTASSLLKNIKTLQHLQQAITISENPLYNLFQKEKKRVQKLTFDKQLFQNYSEQFFVYVEFLRLQVLQILQREKVMRLQSENNQSQFLNYPSNIDKAAREADQSRISTAGMPFNQIKNVEFEMKHQQYGQQGQEGQEGQEGQQGHLKDSQPYNVDPIELEYFNWRKTIALFEIGETDFQQI